jgi:hypothetical protein
MIDEGDISVASFDQSVRKQLVSYLHSSWGHPPVSGAGPAR